MFNHRLLLVLIILFSALVDGRETEEDAAHQVRHLLSSHSEHFSSGVLSTLYPSTHPDSSLRNSALSGPEYFAPCSSNGDLTFLALPVSQNWRNALSEGANVTFSVGSNPNPQVVDWRHAAQGHPDSWDPARPDWRKGMPSKLRVTLFGHIVNLTQLPFEKANADCFQSVHPDSVKWAPGSKDSPHQALWVKMVIDRVYAVGGFGDEHRIGWISLAAYAKAGDGNSHYPKTLLDEEESQSRDISLDYLTLFGETSAKPLTSTLSSNAGSPDQHYFDSV